MSKKPRFKKLESTTIRGVCVRCNKNKQRKAGKNLKDGTDRYKPICSPCHISLYRSDEGRKRDKENRKNYRFSVYNITEEQYLDMLCQQGNKCAICTVSFGGSLKDFIDHCHETGKVRGILCFRCNTALGKMGDTYDSVKVITTSMLKYLK